MKKLLLFLLTLMFGVSALQLSAQDIIQIPDNGGTATNNYLPSHCLYNYSLTQQIYTASEIGTGGSISSIAFYNDGSYDRTRTFSIYMVHTTKTSFSGNSDWITVTANDLVFSGSVTMPTGGWTTIPLTNTFEYDGSSNLAVIVDDNTGSWESSTSYRVFDATDQAIRVYSDGTNYDPMSPNSYSGSVLSVKNQIQLEITPLNVSCPRPSHPTVSDITPYEATLTWSPGDAESEWEIYYTISATDIPDSNTVGMETAYDTTITLTNLTANTYYYAYIRANCGTEYSKWKSVTPFRTQCADIIVLPYTENFENYSTGTTAYPTCWSKLNTTTSTAMPYISTTSYQGSGSLYFYTGTANTYNMAIMEAIDPSISINTLQVSFMYRGSNSTDRLIVGVMDDITDASTFTPVATVYPYFANASTWEERVVDFSNYDGIGTHIAFKNEYTGTSSYAYIDNVKLETISDCNRPTDISIFNYTSEGADIDWTPGGDESNWEVVAVPAGANVSTGIPENATSHPYTLTGLNDNTAYDIYVRASCSSGDNSEWSVNRSFTTNPSCTVARNVTVSQVRTNSALVTWDAALFGASDYTVGYSVADQNNWTTQTVTGTQYLLSDLTINTEYDVFVLTNCDLGEADSVFASFTTRSCLVGGDVFIGDSTSTSSYLPDYTYYNYAYSQQIYLASEMNGPGEINSISFNLSSVNTPNRTIKIYLMHTSSTSDSWLNPSTAQLVYDNSIVWTTGWNTINFTTPFQYNGFDNLAVICVDITGSYSTSNSYYCHTTRQALSRYVYNDGSPYSLPPTDAGSASTNRSDVIFGIPCDSANTCASPNPNIVSTTDNSITVAWTPGNTETSWELEYTADTIWNSEGTVTSPYTISGLTENTTYTIRIRSICGASVESNPVATSGRTACSTVNIPYTETFEDAPGSGYGNMIDCWTTGTNYSSSYPYTSSSVAHAGTYSAYFYGTGSYYSYMATPEFDPSVNINTLQVAFWARKSTLGYYIQVGVMTDPNDYSTFEQVGGNITPDTLNTWQLMEVNLDEYTGNGHYIAFRIPQSYVSYMNIDDINIDVIPTCTHVDNITISGIRASEATVEWTEGGDESSWEIAFVQGTSVVDMDTVVTIPVSSASYTATDLEQNTTYTVYVRAICGSNGNSIWMSAEFMTSQVPAIMPYTCDFEDADVAAAFGIVNGTEPHKWVVGTATNNGGSHALYISNDNGTSNSYSISSASTTWAYRDIEFPASPSGYTLSFDWHAKGEDCCDYMRVFIGNPAPVAAGENVVPAGATSFVPNVNSSYPYYFNASSNYQTFSVIIPGMEETTVKRLYFLWRNDSSVGTNPPAAVDNISISPNYCDAPTNLTVSNITSTSADISWVSTANSSVLSYKGPNDNDWIEIDPATSPQTLTNLDPITTYMVRVANNCDDGVNISPYTTTSFMTACGIIASLPYTENFDSYTASTSSRPNCWSFPVVYSNAPYCTSSYYSSQPNSLYFQSLTTNPTTAVTPQFAEDINNLRVKFMLKAENTTYSGTFEVGVMSDPTDVTTFESVRIIQPANTEWNQYVVDFDSTTMTGGNRYIAFRQNSNADNYYYWLDNVMVMNIPTCPEPNDLISTGNTSTSVTLDWTAGSETDWNIEYGISGFTLGEGDIIPVTTHPYEVDNLDAYLTYDFYVQAVCGAGDESIWIGPFTAAPGVFTFGTNGSSSITACGLILYDNGGPNGNYTSNCDYTLTVYPSDPDSVVSVSGTFAGESTWDYLEIYDGTSTNDVLLEHVMSGSGSSGTVVNFGPITSETGPLTLRFYSDGSNNYAGFAATVSCVGAPDCRTPYGLTASNIAADEATITWTADEGANIELYYKKNSENTWTVVTASEFTDDNTYLMSNLDPATTYNVYVANLCTDDTLTASTITFTTLCAAVTAPYSENFAGFNTAISPCWERFSGLASTVFNGGALTPTTSGWNFYSSNVFPIGHPKINIYGTSCNYWLVSPSIDLSQLNNPTLMFSLALTDYGNEDPIEQMGNQADDKFIVAISTDDGATWLAANATVWDNTGSGDYSYDSISTTGEDIAISLSQFAGQTIRIAFYGESTVSGGDNDLHIANVVVDEPISCPRPHNVTVSNINTTSATLSWAAGGDESSWNIAYGAPGFDPNNTSDIVPASSNPFTLTGLNALTSYEVYVQANCGSGETSLWSSYPVSFATAGCDITEQCEYVFVCTDGYGDGWNGAYITVQQNGVNVATVEAINHNMTSTTTVDTIRVMLCDNVSTSIIWHSGEYDDEIDVAVIGPNDSILYSHSDMETITSNTLLTFTTDCSGSAPVVTDPTVTTNAASAITETTATLNATINNPSSVAITAKGFEWKTTTGGTYTQIAGTGTGNNFTANLTGLTANTSYTYKAFITFNGNTVYGSEMSFTTQNGGGETCNVPTNLTATATAYNTANVTWTAGGTETAWNLRYRTGAANWTTVAATTTSYQLTGLSAQTTYEVQVQAVCSSTSSSDWTASVSFTTPAVPVDPCVAPTGLTISDVTTNSATATWTPGGSETAWNIQYKLQSASQWQEATVQTTSYDIEGLSAASTYEVRVKAICSADNQSDFVTTTFTTGVGIDNITLANSINLMPNPADNYIDLTINSNVEVKEAVVYNAFGQMIQTVELNDNHARIDLSDMAAGMYFVRVNSDNVSATKKFIKR